MKVRHWLGDAGLAVLLALPTATLAGPSAAMWHSRPTASTPHAQLALAERAAASSHAGFPG
jgi:hypothetical protein